MRRLFFVYRQPRVAFFTGVKLDPAYAEQILSGISPLFTINQRQELRFVNRPFEEEFGIKAATVLGRRIFDILPLPVLDREAMLDALQRKGGRKSVNHQFRFRRRIYGYTVFPVGGDQGIILKNITDIRRLERKVQNLHSRLLSAQEEERQRLAAELHDGVGQTIVAAKINLMAYNADRARNESRFTMAVELIDRSSDELREIYSNLYPSVLRELGLTSAIRAALKALEGASIHVDADIDIKRALPEDLEVQVYRLLQELIANTLKHSSATAVSVHIFQNRNLLHLQFDDNGTGFDTGRSAESGFGLQNMRRRVADWQGWLQLISFPGGGSSVQIRLPVRRRMAPL